MLGTSIRIMIVFVATNTSSKRMALKRTVFPPA